jgi:cyclase
MHFDPAPVAELPTQTFASGLTLNINGEQINLTHVAPAHTDTDVFVFFPKANVLHMGDVFFNGFYPFIDASTGGHINGMIAGVHSARRFVTGLTKIVPGHGPVAGRAVLDAYGHMLTTVRDNVQKLKASGKTLAEVQAAKPSADFDAVWGKGRMGPDSFVALVYTTLR